MRIVMTGLMSFSWFAASLLMMHRVHANEHTSVPSEVPQSASTPAIPATVVWKQRRLGGSVLYLLDSASPRLRRFDFATTSWLSDIVLDGNADAFDVDATGIYVKFANRVENVALDGSSRTVVPSVIGELPFIELAGNYLFLGRHNSTNGTSGVASHHKVTGALVNTRNTFSGFGGPSTMDAVGRMFGATIFNSPRDIVVMEFNPASGFIYNSFESPYHARYPDPSTTYAPEAGGIVVVNAGTVYSASSLQYLGSLGGPVQAVVYLSDRFAVMRGGRLAVFSNNLRELGQLNTPANLQDIVAYQGALYTISGAIDSLSIQHVSLDSLAQPPPPAARSWAEAAPKADFILADENKVVLASKVEHAAYTFDPQSWSHAAALPLYLNPLQIAFSPVNNVFYAGYAQGAIYGFPRANPGTASWLSATPYSPQGLATAGQYVFAADPSGAWAAHFTFSPTGTLISNPEWNRLSRQYEWDPVTRRMYFFRDNVSPNDLHWEQISASGSIVASGDSPYHGELIARTPIRVAPDGGRVVLGSGQVLDSPGLTFVGDLATTVADIAWLNGDTYAIRDIGTPELRRYDSAYKVVQSGRVRGTPRRLLPSGSGFLYFADIGASTIIGRLDGDLTKADLAVDPLPVGALFAGGSQISLSVSVGNNGTVPSNGASVSADLSSLGSASWRCVPDAFVSGCSDISVNGSIASVIDLADGGQATYQISGTIPAMASDELRIVVSISPVFSASDPELRNNTQEIVLRLDRMFGTGFE